ncbi:MAG: orotate phosphoribosyltransferase [Chitinophagaceae bacterium]|nr:orotate phosphoribosyltransferase [Chitinophagaceae bacterium]
MTNQKAVAQKLLQIKAIKLNLAEPFTWASGWKSPIYCDNRKALSFPYVREFIKSELCDTIFSTFPDAEVIAGVATAGIPWGAMVADQLKLPFIYVRGKAKDHGLGNQIEGSVEGSKKVVLVEDLISTGMSSLKAADVLLENGMTIEGMVSIFNYGFDESANAFKEHNIRLISLTNYDALVKEAIELKYITQDDEKALLNWRKKPAEWGTFV